VIGRAEGGQRAGLADAHLGVEDFLSSARLMFRTDQLVITPGRLASSGSIKWSVGHFACRQRDNLAKGISVSSTDKPLDSMMGQKQPDTLHRVESGRGDDGDLAATCREHETPTGQPPPLQFDQQAHIHLIEV
jgi:hypothetical protein